MNITITRQPLEFYVKLKSMPRDILIKIFGEYLDVFYIYKMLGIPEEKLCIGANMTFYMDRNVHIHRNENWSTAILYNTSKQETLRIINLYNFRPRDIIYNLELRNKNRCIVSSFKQDDVITVNYGLYTSYYHFISFDNNYIKIQGIDKILDEKITDINGNKYTQFLSNYTKYKIVYIDDLILAQSIVKKTYKHLMFITNIIDLTENSTESNISHIINYDLGVRQIIIGDAHFMFN